MLAIHVSGINTTDGLETLFILCLVFSLQEIKTFPSPLFEFRLYIIDREEVMLFRILIFLVCSSFKRIIL